MSKSLVRLDGSGLRIAIVAARFNDLIVERLVDGAVEALTTHGVSASDLRTTWVPGAWELPVVAQRIAGSGSVDAVVALGAVIKGSTDHYTHVAGQCAAGLMRVQLESRLPVAFGVLTTETIEQCIERAGTKAGNKGVEAAMAALEAALVLRSIG
ncbi:MAG: 6,7-dimethyl-8-ribityllumazine synthase [Ilumatobacteraceae bacterium]